jgi:hypothetical protein
VSNQKTMVDSKTQNEEQNQKTISERAKHNLSDLDLELVTSSNYFKPEPEKTYVIRINPEDKVSMVKNPKFADKDGYVPTWFEFKVTHPNNGVEQTFTVSKTLCKQIADELFKGYQFLEITRHGTDRSTTWNVKGVQQN